MVETDLASQVAALHSEAFGWAVHCCGAGLADEVLQAAYAKVLTETARPGGGGALKTWWFGVVRITALEELRRARRRESGLAKFFRAMFSEVSEPEDARPQPGRQLELDEQATLLRRLLAELPARQSEALHLVFYQSLTIAEAAAVMRVSLGAARQHYERGKRRLRELLEREEAR
jgi:RNA polymerase sigma-70 factor (ECF subfamily)